MKKTNEKRAYQHLGASPKCRLTLKSWLTPGKKIMEIVKTQIELSCKNILNAKNYDFNQQMVF